VLRRSVESADLLLTFRARIASYAGIVAEGENRPEQELKHKTKTAPREPFFIFINTYWHSAGRTIRTLFVVLYSSKNCIVGANPWA
jgi:hypothetical protein